MLRILIYSFICLFALIGFVHSVDIWLRHFTQVAPSAVTVPHTVFAVKNRAETIESELRSVVWHMLAQSRSRHIGDLFVIDLGSDDETPAILSGLAREYDFIHPMTKEKYAEFIQEL